MKTVKIIREYTYHTFSDFQKEIEEYLNDGFEIKEFNTTARNGVSPQSTVLLIKENKKEF